jgi:hypothetical protein
VRFVDRLAIHLAKAIADRDDAPLRRALPLGLGRGWHALNLRPVRERTIEVDGLTMTHRLGPVNPLKARA